MDKVAFLTMDAEGYGDTECLRDRGFRVPPGAGCAGMIGEFLSLAEQYGARATLFVTADFIPEAAPYLQSALRRGHELALHAGTHEPPLRLSPEAFAQDLSRGVREMQRAFGVTPRGYRAPCFALDDERLAAVRRQGFLYDASAMEIRTPEGGCLDLSAFRKMNDTVCCDGGFYEVKPSVGRMFFRRFPVSGGGYLRLAPWFAVKNALGRYLRRADSFVLYVHPFELFPGKLPVPKDCTPGERWYLSRGRKKYLARVERVLKLLRREGYRFSTVSSYLDGLSRKEAADGGNEG